MEILSFEPQYVGRESFKFVCTMNRPGTIRKFKLEYYYSNTTIRKKPMVSTGYNYSNSIRIVIISNSTRSNLWEFVRIFKLLKSHK